MQKKLYKGTELSIPQSDGIMYEVKKGDSLSRIAGKYDISFNRLLDMNDLESSLIRTGQKLFIPDASISSFELKKHLVNYSFFQSEDELHRLSVIEKTRLPAEKACITA